MTNEYSIKSRNVCIGWLSYIVLSYIINYPLVKYFIVPSLVNGNIVYYFGWNY